MVKTVLPLHGARVPSLVEELRSHMPCRCSQKKKKKEREREREREIGEKMASNMKKNKAEFLPYNLERNSI